MSQSVQDNGGYIKVNVPPKSDFKKRVKQRAEELGMPMGTVLRVAFDNYDILLDRRQAQGIPMLSDEVSESVGRALRDYKQGKYKELKSDKEIDQYFDSL